MRWRFLGIGLSIFMTFDVSASEWVAREVETHQSNEKLPTIVRVIALHDIPSNHNLWKPVQTLADFDSIVNAHSRALGVAFAIDNVGNLATAAHVVEDSRCLWIVRDDGQVMPAVVVGIDRRSDLAVIRTLGAIQPFEFSSPDNIESAKLTLRTGADPLFNSTPARYVGENRSLPTLTEFTGRDYSNLIEFAGPARAGDSGSPLIDHSGRVIAMLCAVIERCDAPTSGFAIPIDSVTKTRIRQMANGEQIRHGYAGVELSNIADADEPAVRVNAIARHSPAHEVLHTGDQIKSINHEPITSAQDASRLIDASPDQTLRFEIVRAAKPLTVELPIRARHARVDRPSPGRFIWAGMVFPIEQFEKVVSSTFINTGEISNDAIKAPETSGKTTTIEVWREGTRIQ